MADQTGGHRSWGMCPGGWLACDHCGMSRDHYDDDPEGSVVCGPDPSEAALGRLYDTAGAGARERHDAAWRQHRELHRR